MKKIAFLFVAAAAIAFLGSCSKQENALELPTGPVALRATMEEPSATGTKAYLENTSETTKRVFWAENDKILVFNESGDAADIGNEFTLTEGAGTNSGTFTGTISADRPMTAFYPKEGLGSAIIMVFPDNHTYDKCTLAFTLPAEQKYIADSFDKDAFPMATAPTMGDALSFKNLCGLLKIQLKGTAKVKSITITDDNNGLQGEFKVVISDTYGVEVKEPSIKNHSVTLDCDDAGGVQLNSTTSTPFYIILPPGTLSTGFSVTITDMAGNIMTKSTSVNNTIERSKITVMPPMEFNTGANSYILPAGSPGTFTFYAGRKGNSTSSGDNLSPKAVRVLWEDNTSGSIISSVLLDESSKMVTVTYTGTKGNALVVVKTVDSGDIIWSWHLWVTDTPGEIGVFMDRNLGAKSTNVSEESSYGLLYQWGRKDPLTIYTLSTEIGAVALSHSINNPFHFIYVRSSPYDWLDIPNNYLWSTKTGNEGGALGKSLYDPCPAGWRVPAAGTSFAGVVSSLPKAGILHYSNGSIQDKGTTGYYWVSSGELSESINKGLAYSTSNSMVAGYQRAYAFSVRCVKE